MVVDETLPQLLFLLWNRTHREVSDEEALALYEGNRGWVDPESMTPHERRYFDELVARCGRGVFLG